MADMNPALLSHVYIALDGTTVPAEFMADLLELTVECSLHLPDVASITLHDPHLRWIDDARLEPGKQLRVSAKSVGSEKPIFDGEIVEIEPNFTPGTQRLVVRAFDRLHRLSRGSYVRTFTDVTDGDVVQKIAREVGLSAKVGPARHVHPYVIQANRTNLEFLQERAASLGYLLYVEDKTLCFVPPQPNKGKVEVAWGRTLTEFRPRMTTIEQVGTVTARGWDPESCKAVVGQANKGQGAPEVGEKRPGGEMAKKAFSLDAPFLVTDRPLRVHGVAERLAQAIADERNSYFIEAEGQCTGDPAITAGGQLKISAVGNRFTGDYFVTGATHVYIPDAGYVTQFSVSGQHPATLLGLLNPHPISSSISGVVIAIVTDNQDPNGQGRVKVKFPWLSDEHTSYWARLATIGAGAERGIEFLPEVNDEVLVGFEHGDMHYPYILGGLWNGRDAPPRKSGQIVQGGKVQERLIRSRTGHLIILDDKEGAGGITLRDRKGNYITIESGKDQLNIQVRGNATIKAQDVKVEAMSNLELKAASIKVQSSGRIQIQAGADVEIHGAQIRLN